MGSGALQFSQRAVQRNERIDFGHPVKELTFRSGTRAERIIVTGQHVIRACYKKRGKIEHTDFNSERPFGRIREFLLWGFARFTQPVPLSEGLFIANLVTLSGEKTNPYVDF